MSSAPEPTSGRPGFAVLCVCEGNLCRSPVAQLLLADALGPAVTVSSAGTRAVVGSPVAPGMRKLLAGRHVEADGHRARQLGTAELRAADLVLTMTTDQRRQVVERAPAVVRRTFTLRELARLLADVTPADVAAPTLAERFRRALPLAAAQRRQVEPGADDIADPYGRDDAAYRQAFREVGDAVDTLVAVLGDGSTPGRWTRGR